MLPSICSFSKVSCLCCAVLMLKVLRVQFFTRNSHCNCLRGERCILSWHTNSWRHSDCEIHNLYRRLVFVVPILSDWQSNNNVTSLLCPKQPQQDRGSDFFPLLPKDCVLVREWIAKIWDQLTCTDTAIFTTNDVTGSCGMPLGWVDRSCAGVRMLRLRIPAACKWYHLSAG